MSLPKYPEYKQSEISWLGEIPAHWGRAKLKTLVQSDRRITYGIVQAGPDTPGGVPYIRPADMSDEAGVVDKERILRTTPEIAESYRRSAIRAGDLVCSIGPSFGKLMVVPDWLDGGNLTQGTARVVVSNDNSPKFIFWALRCEVSVAQWEAGIGGATFRALNLEPLANTWLVRPPRPEQAAIAAFLDCETAKIDTLIAEQEKLLTLLAEKRQATISHAVTRGLDPNAPMKDSGVPWLGEVPAHWEVKPLGTLAERVSYGFTNPMPTTDEGPYLLTANDVGMGFIDYESARRTSWDAFKELLTDKSRPRKGDVLITKDGTLGRVAVFAGGDACINQSVAVLRVDSSVAASTFLALALSGGVYQDRMVFEAGGTTIKHIYISRLVKMPVAIPSLHEQGEITLALQGQLERLDELNARAGSAVELLRERRSALISAAVTGKIDVRGLAEAQAA